MLPRIALSLAVIAFAGRAHAQSAAVTVEGRESSITTRGVPDHALLWVRNPTAAPITIRVARGEYVDSQGPRLGVGNFRFSLGDIASRGSITVPPHTDDALWVHFEYTGPSAPDNRQQFVYEFQLEVNHRPVTVRSTVNRATRHPWHSRSRTRSRPATPRALASRASCCSRRSLSCFATTPGRPTRSSSILPPALRFAFSPSWA